MGLLVSHSIRVVLMFPPPHHARILADIHSTSQASWLRVECAFVIIHIPFSRLKTPLLKQDGKGGDGDTGAVRGDADVYADNEGSKAIHSKST